VAKIDDLSNLDSPEIINSLFKNSNDLFFSNKKSCLTDETSVKSLSTKLPDGAEIHCRIFPGIPSEPHILFFPAEYDIETNITSLANGFVNLDITLIAMYYRGWVKNSGKLSISTLPQDAEAFYRVAKDWHNNEQRTGPLVFMGRSIGSAIALDLACRHEDDSLALIMESAFDLTEDFLRNKGIETNEMAIVKKDFFSNRSKISTYRKAVLFLHSHRDQIISPGQIERLVRESRSKATQLQIVPSSCREDIAQKAGDLYFNVIKDFLDRRMGKRLYRKRIRKKE
jgi:alpha-beta hydrolase superfamily lysophospholipase